MPNGEPPSDPWLWWTGFRTAPGRIDPRTGRLVYEAAFAPPGAAYVAPPAPPPSARREAYRPGYAPYAPPGPWGAEAWPAPAISGGGGNPRGAGFSPLPYALAVFGGVILLELFGVTNLFGGRPPKAEEA